MINIYQKDRTNVEYFSLNGGNYVRKTVNGLTGRILIAHEVKVLERLKGINGVQQLVEQDSTNSFISHYIESTSLLTSKNLATDYFERLSLILREVHFRGIADLDFAHSVDLLVGKKGEPHIIDLASSFIYDKNSPSSVFVKPFFDYTCWLNHKYIVARKARFLPEQLTLEERNASQDLGILANSWRKLRRSKSKN